MLPVYLRAVVLIRSIVLQDTKPCVVNVQLDTDRLAHTVAYLVAACQHRWFIALCPIKKWTRTTVARCVTTTTSHMQIMISCVTQRPAPNDQFKTY